MGRGVNRSHVSKQEEGGGRGRRGFINREIKLICGQTTNLSHHLKLKLKSKTHTELLAPDWLKKPERENV